MPFKDNQYLNFVFLQNLGLYFWLNYFFELKLKYEIDNYWHKKWTTNS